MRLPTGMGVHWELGITATCTRPVCPGALHMPHTHQMRLTHTCLLSMWTSVCTPASLSTHVHPSVHTGAYLCPPCMQTVSMARYTCVRWAHLSPGDVPAEPGTLLEQIGPSPPLAGNHKIGLDNVPVPVQSLQGSWQVVCADQGPASRYSLMRLVELGTLKKSGRYSHLMRVEFMGMAWLQRHG